MGYLANFLVYTFAMVGLMMIALFIFKKSTGAIKGGCGKYLKVVDTMSIGPRKTLYIVSTGAERFLIAGDVDRTTLISKLDSQNLPAETVANVMTKEEPSFATQSFSDTMSDFASRKKYTDYSSVGIKSSLLNPINKRESSVMKNLAEIMRK